MPNKKKTIMIWESLADLGGGQRVALDILDALTDNYEILFFVPEEGKLTEELKKRGVEYEKLPIGKYSIGKKSFFDLIKLWLYFFPVLFGAVRSIRKHKPDLIYSNGARTFIWSALIGRLSKVPVIWHIHNIFLSKTSVRVINTAAKLGRVSLVLALCKASKDQFPDLADKIKVISNAIDIEKAKQKSQTPRSIREELNISSNKKIISTISWIGEPKNQLTFIKAIPYIIKERNDTCFIVVGGVSKGEERYHEKLRETVKSLKLQDKVFFLGYRENICFILKDSFINTVNSFGFEACPLIILESAVFGIPTVGAAVGGTKELIENNSLGLLYNHCDEKDLADKILSLLNNDNLYAYLSNNCKHHAESFDIKIFNDRIRKVIAAILDHESAFS